MKTVGVLRSRSTPAAQGPDRGCVETELRLLRVLAARRAKHCLRGCAAVLLCPCGLGLRVRVRFAHVASQNLGPATSCRPILLKPVWKHGRYEVSGRKSCDAT